MNIKFRSSKPKENISASAILKRYTAGERKFHFANLQDVELPSLKNLQQVMLPNQNRPDDQNTFQVQLSDTGVEVTSDPIEKLISNTAVENVAIAIEKNLEIIETMQVHLAPSLRPTDYGRLYGKSLQLPKNKAYFPRKDALQWRCNQCEWYG